MDKWWDSLSINDKAIYIVSALIIIFPRNYKIDLRLPYKKLSINKKRKILKLLNYLILN